MWQLTYTLYAAFNLLLVSLGFGNPHITTQDPGFIADAATVCCHLFLIYRLLGLFCRETSGPVCYSRNKNQQLTHTSVHLGHLFAVRSYYGHTQNISWHFLPSNRRLEMAQDNCICHRRHCSHLHILLFLRHSLLLWPAFPLPHQRLTRKMYWNGPRSLCGKHDSRCHQHCLGLHPRHLAHRSHQQSMHASSGKD